MPGRCGPDRDVCTLRGTPPSPRNPPTGCRFVTRCPAKVRPDEYADLPEDAWTGIEEFHTVLRARARADDGLLERLKAALGASVGENITETTQELFGDVELGSAQSVVDEAVETAQGGDDSGAAALVREEFGSICNEEEPDEYVVDSDGRLSQCVRHEDGYDAPEVVIERRLNRRTE